MRRERLVFRREAPRLGILGDGKLFDESPIHQIECLFSRGAEPRRFPGRFTPSSTDGTGRVGRALLIAVERPAYEYRGQRSNCPTWRYNHHKWILDPRGALRLSRRPTRASGRRVSAGPGLLSSLELLRWS